jgi:hypothetical protein
MHKDVMANLSNCSVSLDAQTVDAGSTKELLFDVINNDSKNSIKWVKITRASDYYHLDSSTSGFSQSIATSDVIYTTGTINPATNSYFFVTITVPNLGETRKYWQVTASDDPIGNNAITCSGTLPTEIVLPEGPTISGISVSNISDTSVRISWGTDRDAGSIVDYGLSDSYGSSATTAEINSIHSVLLGGLWSGTIYHYRIRSVDNQGLIGVSGDGTFTTSGIAVPTPTGSSESPVTQITPSVTPTGPTSSVNTVRVLVTPTPIPDTSAPSVILQPLSTKPYRVAPVISGTAIDNKAVSMVEYNVDSGKNWTNVANIFMGESLQFGFTPSLTSGKHLIKVRAKDVALNISQIQSIMFSIDSVGPVVIVNTDLKKPYIQAPDITISVSDESGIGDAFISIDGGLNWQVGEKDSTKSASRTDVAFQLPSLDDGNYELKFKVFDSVGNVTQTLGYKLVIDRLPPKIGNPVVSVGPLLLDLTKNNIYQTLIGLENKVTVSVIGGPTEVIGQIEVGKTNEIASQIKFIKISGKELWEGVMIFPNPGPYRLNLHATDGANNNTEKVLGSFLVLSGGKVTDGAIGVPDAKVTVYTYNQSQNRYLPWDAPMYGSKNPRSTLPDGSYKVILPSGKYYLQVEKFGYSAVQTDIFNNIENYPVTLNLPLIKQKSFQIGPFRIVIPDFSTHTVSVVITDNQITTPQQIKTEFTLPDTNLTDGTVIFSSKEMRGKPTVIAFLNTWQPNTVSELNILEGFALARKDVNLIVILSHESQFEANIFKKRGGFALPLIADPDGILDPIFDFGSNPAFYFADNKGDIKAVSGSLLTETELTAALGNVMMK